MLNILNLEINVLFVVNFSVIPTYLYLNRESVGRLLVFKPSYHRVKMFINVWRPSSLIYLSSFKP